MGNANTKKETLNYFNAEETRMLEAAYRRANGNGHRSGSNEKLTSEKLVASWSQTIERGLAEKTAQFLFTTTNNEPTIHNIQMNRFSEPFYIMQHGTIEMKMKILLGSMDKVNGDSFNIKELEQYIFLVVKSFLHLESTSTQSCLKDWQNIGYTMSDRSVYILAKCLLKTIGDLQFTMPVRNLEGWLHMTPLFVEMWKEVFFQLYSRHGGTKRNSIVEMKTGYLPQLCDAPQNNHYQPIIEFPHILFINANIPQEFRHKWRFLFSSKINGQSFSTMLGKIINKGPTLIIVEDEDQYIFGGFAPHSWALKPTFAGDDSSMLFTFSPAMRCFNATGYNDHFQYLNLNQQTMPNGLGMGGQMEYWGLWIDGMFGEGQSSESCSTYRDYVQLSNRKNFQIRYLEVWGLGDLPVKDEDDEESEGKGRSVLDKNKVDCAMLEIAGKKMHSAGLREPEPEDY